jgi:hypothetical protein
MGLNVSHGENSRNPTKSLTFSLEEAGFQVCPYCTYANGLVAGPCVVCRKKKQDVPLATANQCPGPLLAA